MPTVTIAILVVTGTVTVAGFMRPEIIERFIFNPYDIIGRKQYERLFTSALIHANVPHFLFNAISLYSFGSEIEQNYGPKPLLLIYLCSVLAGGLLSLLIHRNQRYRALGASGGVCGVVFASIFLVPGGSIMIFFLPIAIPAFFYGIGFLIYSLIGHLRQRDNIGHDAHLGGAIAGLLLSAVLAPGAVFSEPLKFYSALGLAVCIALFFIFSPRQFAAGQSGSDINSPGMARAREYDENRSLNEKKAELDRLLDKVSRDGIHKLTSAERQRLDELSREI
jgi:membrane associated rhomboid family serine protease